MQHIIYLADSHVISDSIWLAADLCGFPDDHFFWASGGFSQGWRVRAATSGLHKLSDRLALVVINRKSSTTIQRLAKAKSIAPILEVKNAILDGQVCCLGRDGRSVRSARGLPAAFIGLVIQLLAKII